MMTDIDTTISSQNEKFTPVRDMSSVYESNQNYWVVGLFDTNYFFKKESLEGHKLKTMLAEPRESEETIFNYLNACIVKNSDPNELYQNLKINLERSYKKGQVDGREKYHERLQKLLDI